MPSQKSNPYALEPHLSSSSLEELFVCLVNYLYPETTNKHLLVDLFSRIPIKGMENFEWSVARVTQIFARLTEKKLVNREHKLPIHDGHALTVYFTKLDMGREFIKQLPARLRSSRVGIVSYQNIQKTQCLVDFYLNETKAMESAKKAFFSFELPISYYAQNPIDDFYQKLKPELQLWIARLRIRKALSTQFAKESFLHLDEYVSFCISKRLYSSSFLSYFAFVKYDMTIYAELMKILKVSREDGTGYFIDTYNLFSSRTVEDCIELTKDIKLSFKGLRKYLGKKQVSIENIFELFYLFTLVKAQNDVLHKEALKKEFINYTKQAISPKYSMLLDKLMTSSFVETRLYHDIDKELTQSNYDYIICFIIVYAQLKLDENSRQSFLNVLKKYFDEYKELVPFLALLISQILSRLLPAGENSIYLEYKDKYEIFDFSALFLQDISWEKKLEAISSFLNAEEKRSAKKVSQNPKRLVWNVSFPFKEIIPYEQSYSKNTWTKGRKLSVARLRDEKESIDYLTEQDKDVIRQAAKKDYWRDVFEIDYEIAMPLLVGHELVFNDESGEKLILELEEAELKVDFKKNKDNKEEYVLSLNLPGSQIGTYIRKEQNIYKITPVSSSHIQLKELLGEDKLHLPQEAHKKVIQLISTQHNQVKVSTNQELSLLSHDMVNSKPTLRLSRASQDALALDIQAIVYPLGNENSSFIPENGTKVFVAKHNNAPIKVERNFAAEKNAMDELLSLCPTLKENLLDEKYSWNLAEPEISYNTLIELQEKNIDVEWFENDPIRITSSVSYSDMRLKVKSKNSWFSVEGNLQVDSSSMLSMLELLKKVRESKGRFIPLANGKILALAEDFRLNLEKLDAITQEGKESLLLHPLAASSLDVFFDNSEEIESDEIWKEWREKLSSLKNFDEKIAIPSGLQADLRSYQVEGFEWLASLTRIQAGACLADDMGLGKTLQTITLILHLIKTSTIEEKRSQVAIKNKIAESQKTLLTKEIQENIDNAEIMKSNAILILAPTSVCHNWESEIQKFAPQINCIRFTAATSKKERTKSIENLKENDVLILGYGLLSSEMPTLLKQKFKLIIFDEAQALKNSKTLRSKSSAKLMADSKIALTGTPIENSLEDLWSIFNIINPGLLGSLENFNDKFNLTNNESDAIRNKARSNLRSLVKPFILRRTKSAVLEELPARTEQTLIIEPSKEERALYEAIRVQALKNIEEAKEEKGANASKFFVLAELTRLRRVCCNPLLIDPNSQIESSKLSTLLELIKDLRQNNHQVLIFSQFTSHLKIVYDQIKNIGFDSLYLDGSTQEKKRAELVHAFQNGMSDIFCISLKAGGQGLNLTAADYVIHLDPWWNPAVEDQASDRAHRMGQTRPVTVYRLIMQDSVEEKILKLHSSKRELAEDVLADTNTAQKLSLNELMELFG